VFDLERDPEEQRPAAWPGPESSAGPPALLGAFRNDPDPSGLPAKQSILVGRRLDAAKPHPDGGLPVVSQDVDPVTLERLRALGYVQ
jgi:hypothetical protein